MSATASLETSPRTSDDDAAAHQLSTDELLLPPPPAQISELPEGADARAGRTRVDDGVGPRRRWW